MSRSGSSYVFSTPARLSILVLLIGLAAGYVLLSRSVVGVVENSGLDQQLKSQALIAALIRDQLAQRINSGADIVEVFESQQLGQTVSASWPDVSIYLASPAAEIFAGPEGGHLPIASDLTGYKVYDSRLKIELLFSEFLEVGQTSPGRMMTAGGERLELTVAAAKLVSNGWYVLVAQDAAPLADVVDRTWANQTLAFLALAVLLLMLIVAFYISLAGGLSSAINSAVALEEATKRFEENTGSMRTPLTTIQGLADMLVITDDPDERQNYLNEIKSEVKRMITAIEAPGSIAS